MSAGLAVEVYQTQADFVTDAHRYTAFVGGRNSGKTFAGSLKAIALAGRGGLGCIAAPNFPMLEYGAKRQFITRLDEAGEAYTLTRSGVVIPRFRAEIIFVTLESESRVRGPNYSWGWADEVEYVADRGIWRAFKGAVRDGESPQLFVTTTPKGRRLVWDEWVVGKTQQHALHKATTFDNPFIDATDYVSGLGYEGVFYDQEIIADFVSFEGLVYPAFDREHHVQTVDCEKWGTILAVDIGTRNPTAVLTIRHAGDRIHVERELYRRGMGSSEIVAAVVAETAATKAPRAVVDPSAAGLIKDLHDAGVRAAKANNEVIVGISRVTSTLATLTVDPSCVNLIAEFESYQYPDGGKADKDSPVKANDHCFVAGTMVETEHGAKPIERIRVGERVWTRDGLRPAIAAGMTQPSAQVFHVTATDGRRLTGTAWHPVWTRDRRWVCLNALRYDDMLSTWTNEWTSSSSTALPSDDTRTRQPMPNGRTTSRTPGIVGAALVGFMKKSGSRLTDLSRRTITSITRIVTRSTTIQATSNVLLVPHIVPFMPSIHRATVSVPTSKTSGRSPQNGTDPMRAGLGTVNTAGRHGLSANLSNGRANTAAHCSPRSLSEQVIGFAPTAASRLGVVPVASMTKTAPVSVVARRSESIATRVPVLAPVSVLSVTVEPARQAVYNLTVEGAPEFFANGILVHNCMDALRYAIMDLTGGRTPPSVAPQGIAHRSDWR